MSEEKRKIKLINRDFQYKLMAKFILINGLILALFGAIIYVFFNSEIDTNLKSATAAYSSVAQMLLPIIVTLSVLAILITSIIIIMVVLNASHKIAGPLFRFNKALNEIENKNLKPYSNIRAKDQLGGLADSFSKMTDVLASDVSKMKELTLELSNTVIDPKGKELVEELYKLILSYKLD